MERTKTPARRYVLDRFAGEYFIDNDVSRAAKATGVSRKTAHEWLKTPYVINKLDELRRQQSNRLEITADAVTQELAKIAFLDIAACFDEDGQLLPLSKIPANTRRAIAGLDLEEICGKDEDGETVVIGKKGKLKMLGKVEALKLLGQHLGLWSEESAQGPATVNVVINGIIKEE